MCAVYRLRMAARQATRLYDAHLKPSGLGIAQYGVLSLITAMDGASVTAIAERLAMDRTTMTRNLAPLIRGGYVKIGTGKNRRTRAVQITDKGRAAIARATPLWAAAQSQLAADLGPAFAPLQTALGAAIPKIAASPAPPRRR